MRHFVISLGARAEPETHLLGGVAHGRGGGGAGASTQRESSDAALVGEGASGRSSPALACATTVARLPAQADAGRGRVPAPLGVRREDAPEGTGERRHGASEGGCARAGSAVLYANTRGRTKARRGCDGRGPGPRGCARENSFAFLPLRLSFRETLRPRLRRSSVCDSRNRLDRERSSPPVRQLCKKTPTRHLRAARSDYAPIQEKYKISKVCSEARAKANIETLVILEPSDG